MSLSFSLSIIQTRKTVAPSWEDAEQEALLWSLDEKASGYSVSQLREDAEALV